METTDALFEILNGSAYAIWLYRLFGARIGNNACLLGSPLEFDLLTVGDYGTIGGARYHRNITTSVYFLANSTARRR